METNTDTRRSRVTHRTLTALALGVPLLLGGCGYMSGYMQDGMMAMMPGMVKEPMKNRAAHKMQELSPAKGYLAAHRSVEQPLDLLGGPVRVTVRQEAGGVFVALPDKRRLDPDVFGTPKNPRGFGGTPGIYGVPVMARKFRGNEFKEMRMTSPFGDKHVVLPDGVLDLNLLDVTATDAAVTRDEVSMTASWKDEQGNSYSVSCCKKVIAHGVEFPTFGGVVTNHLLHGITRIGTPLMPTEFTYAAFWGMGEVKKNGQVVDAPRLIHGMLTEYVRTEGYRLAFDREVTPGRLQFHLMVAPFKPAPTGDHFEWPKAPVRTGYTLPDGKPLEFWHVMFENLEVEAHRG